MYALYYDGQLLGMITNPSVYPGGIEEICGMLSPNEGSCEAQEIPTSREFDCDDCDDCDGD